MRKSRLTRQRLLIGIAAFYVGIYLHDNADKAYKTITHPTPAFTVLNIGESLLGLAIGLVGGWLIFIAACSLAGFGLTRLREIAVARLLER